MPRPRRQRRIQYNPPAEYFKPRGIPMTHLQEEVLSREEIEALRLKHIEGLDQEAVATAMHTSQSTVQRILATAHATIARALVEGKALKIERNNNQ